MKLAHGCNTIQPNSRYNNAKVLSWSDIVAIENGTYGKSIPKNRKMEFGTYIHKLIENNQLPVSVPRGVMHEIKVKHGKFVGTIDSCDYETIIDYKTATKHWSRLKAENHDQLVYYAYLFWKQFKIQPKQYKIVSLQTGWNEDEELTVIGAPRVHTVPISLVDLLKVKARAERAILTLKANHALGTA